MAGKKGRIKRKKGEKFNQGTRAFGEETQKEKHYTPGERNASLKSWERKG